MHAHCACGSASQNGEEVFAVCVSCWHQCAVCCLLHSIYLVQEDRTPPPLTLNMAGAASTSGPGMDALPAELKLQIVCLAVKERIQRSQMLALCKLVSKEWCGYARLASIELQIYSEKLARSDHSHLGHLRATLQNNPQLKSLCLCIDHLAPIADWGGFVSVLASHRWAHVTLACDSTCDSISLAALLSNSYSTLQTLLFINATLEINDLDQVFRQAVNLQGVSLAGKLGMSPQRFAALLADAGTCPQVKELKVDELWYAGEDEILRLPDNQCLTQIPKTFPNLRALTFTASASVPPEAYAALAGSLPCLESLSITGTQLSTLDDAVLSSIVRCCPLLRELALGSPLVSIRSRDYELTTNITAVGLVAILDRCPFITSLKLPCLSEITEEAWSTLLQKMRNLQTLECPWDCKVIPAFNVLKKLKRLTLFDWGIQVIEKVNLEHLARIVGQLPMVSTLRICSANLEMAVVEIMKPHMSGVALETYLSDGEKWRIKKH